MMYRLPITRCHGAKPRMALGGGGCTFDGRVSRMKAAFMGPTSSPIHQARRPGTLKRALAREVRPMYCASGLIHCGIEPWRRLSSEQGGSFVRDDLPMERTGRGCIEGSTLLGWAGSNLLGVEARKTSWIRVGAAFPRKFTSRGRRGGCGDGDERNLGRLSSYFKLWRPGQGSIG